MISPSECGVVLFVVLCDVFVVPYCCGVHLISIEKIGFSQLQIQPMIWASTLQIRRHGYFGDFNFIILFVVGILPLYAINLDAVNFVRRFILYVFSDADYVIVFDVFYQFK